MGEISLFFALVGIYLWECLIWADDETLLIDIATRPAVLLREAALPPLFHRSGVYLSNLYPKHGQVAVCAKPRLFPSIEAVSFHPHPDSRLFRYDEMTQIAISDCRVVVNGAVVMNTQTTEYAEHVADLLTRLRNGSKADRETLLHAELARSMDVVTIRSRVNSYRDATRRLLRDETAGLLLIFIALPIILLLGIERLAWPVGVVVVVAMLGFLIWDFRVASHRLHARRSMNDFALLALSPFAALRAHHILASGMLEGFDQVAISKSICDEATFRQIASLALRVLSFPIACPLSQPEVEHDRDWRTRYLQHLDKLLGPTLSRQQLLAAPLRQPDCLSYCPRCESQYVLSTGMCSDCNIRLVSFST